MAKITKRDKAMREKLAGTSGPRPVNDALDLLKKCSSVKFDESVEVAVNLGIDAKKSDQVVRGSTVLPRGTGKTVRVAVFAQGKNAEAAKEAGADIVGFDDLAAKVKGGEIDFDRVIATPDAMKVVGQLGQILGPRGLMPNPKTGTVTADVAGAVKAVKGGQVQYRADKAGIIHCAIGKVSFDVTALRENFDALMSDLRKAKPSTSKGIYFKKVTLSTTMGPGIVVDRTELPS
ncbi:MAG: 50S ribosomal protein L1 [Gammaproteobacteria bacterium]